jgi:hypothetical protein
MDQLRGRVWVRPFAVKTEASAERDRVVAALRPAPLAPCGLDVSIGERRGFQMATTRRAVQA